jgi:hypothetical protein
MKLPIDFEPVLALIESIDSLGKRSHYEVVYYDNEIAKEWKSYSGSDTFKDGERVLSWEYCKNIELKNK